MAIYRQSATFLCDSCSEPGCSNSAPFCFPFSLKVFDLPHCRVAVNEVVQSNNMWYFLWVMIAAAKTLPIATGA
jgi:hypothetical protein